MKVIDVILHRNKYSVQPMLVVDRDPEFLYEEKIIEGRKVLVARDGIFSSLYYFERPNEMFQAFAGRKFKIPLKNGLFIEAHGQWWNGYLPEATSIGIGTPEGLSKCNVFCSVGIDKIVLTSILNKRKNPSNNYSKYDKSSKDFGKHIIDSPWKEAKP